jgi:hypothetical protein
MVVQNKGDERLLGARQLGGRATERAREREESSGGIISITPRIKEGG